MTAPATPELITFGCRLNAAESDTVRRLAASAGLDDIIVINTCAVTEEAERQARQAIRRARRANPTGTIVVTGCAAQIDPASYVALPEVDYVLGNAEKLQPALWAGLKSHARVRVGNIMRDAPAPTAAISEQRSRAFIEVQQGCDHRCTFCVIPYGRGNSRSARPDEIAARARELALRGVNEVVLTGIDLVSWGRDLPGAPSFACLIGGLLEAVPELPRLRLSSLDPAAIDDEFIRLFGAERRLMPHLHLSLQAGDDLILKRMKRRHSRAQALDVIGRLRQARPDTTFGADLIAGFPTEDECMFERTLGLIGEAALDLVHVFPFSARPGTPAARIAPLPAAAVQRRAATLRAAGVQARAAFLARQVGRRASVVVERNGSRALAENFAPVLLDRPARPGSLVTATLTRVADHALLGILAETAAA